MRYDLVVAGLGGMGSAVLAHASTRAGRVLGIEQFARGHDLGSSSGRSRIIRKTYFEDPAYVPLLMRAYDLWHELQAATAAPLMDLTGILAVGTPQSTVIRGMEASSAAYDLPLQRLDAAAIASRFPGTQPRAEECGLFERDAGMLYPEAAIEAHLRAAEANGAQTAFETAISGYDASANGIEVRLSDGRTIETARLAFCAGPWTAQILRELQLPLRVQRNVQLWFRPQGADFCVDRFPAFFVERAGWPAALYGFPDFGDGVKAALHGFGDTTGPAELDRSIRPDDIAAVQAVLEDWMPAAAGECVAGKACMYTLTPDEHFIIDLHPRDPRIAIAAGFSGHGYKFAPVVGEIVAQLALEGGTPHPIGFLRLERFHASTGSG